MSDWARAALAYLRAVRFALRSVGHPMTREVVAAWTAAMALLPDGRTHAQEDRLRDMHRACVARQAARKTRRPEG